jgi:hypothetical protein
MESGSREVLRSAIASGIGLGAVCLAERRRARLVTACLDIVAEAKAAGAPRPHPSSRSSTG